MLPPVFGVLFDGIAYGMLLFVLSVGLSVTLGLMNFVNLAHCAFAMLGGYTTVVLMQDLHWPFFATLPAAFFVAALASIVVERTLYRRLYRASDLDQVLLTIGLAFISVAVAAWFFTTQQQPIEMPGYMRGSFNVLGLNIAVYRLFLIAVGVAVTVLLIMTVEHTRFGAQVRAAVDNQRMARGLGIELDPSFAFTYLVYVLIVVSVGGLGSIAGSFAAACLIGVSDVAGKYYVPELGAFLIYLVMVGVLMWRPSGLFGRR
jgi:branched-chain amino acid transport system permease protein